MLRFVTKRAMSEIKKTVQPKWFSPVKSDKKPELKLFNSLTRSKDEFVPINSNTVTWYSCGPTVYDSSHMGHARNYVTIDINRRILQDYFGCNVVFVQNVTDIDDKIIIRARQNYLFDQFVAENKKINDELINFVKECLVEFSAKNVSQSSINEITNWLSTAKVSELAVQNPKIPMYHKAIKKAHDAINNPESKDFFENVKDVVTPSLDAKFGSKITDPEIFKSLPSYWENQFDLDMKSLNVLPPSVKTRVSEYVPEIIQYVEKIIANGYAYSTKDGSVYFNTAKFDQAENHSYAKLQPWNRGELSLIAEGEGSLSSNDGKLSPNDFALWKASKPGEPSWESPWGKGRPGWHIECSVMASEILGPAIDIHSGGIDLAFPHHDNELAQSEAHYDCKQWINYFLHTGHLHIEGQKMSKSLKNFITIQEALQKYSARQLRLSFALVAWNNQLDFKESLLSEVKSIESSFSKFFTNVRALNNDIQSRIDGGEIISEKFGAKEIKLFTSLNEIKAQVHEAFCDNLNTPQVIKLLNELTNQTYTYLSNDANIVIRPVLEVTKYITKILSVLGFEARSDLLGWTSSNEDSSNGDNEAVKLEFAQTISQIRDDIRSLGISSKNGDLLKLSDRIRDEDLLNLGVSIDDRTEGKGLVKILTTEEKNELVSQRNEKIKKLREKEEKKLQLQRAKEQQEKEKLAKAKIDPVEMFKDATKYSEYDENGVPTKDNTGEELSKSARKKLLKQWGTQKKLHDEYLKQHQS